MTTATAPPRAAAIPAPPGAREPFRAPPPEACEWCGGDGWEPLDESIRCARCNWTGAEALPEWRLPRTRAYELRRLRYWPAAGASGHPNRLLLETAAREGHRPTREWYTVTEMATDWPGRSFALRKSAGRPAAYSVYCGRDAVSCDCPGFEYLASAKANQDAHDRGDEVYVSFGCKHACALVALLLGGWFDI